MRLLFIDIDTLRADHMGCYGYKRNTTPVMDKIAESSMRFDRYYCPNAPCLPSRASLISGQFGIRTGVVGHGGTAADMRIEGYPRSFKTAFAQHNLFNEFRKAGYHTASVSTFPERHSSYWFTAGFNECFNVGESGNETGNKVTAYATDWLERNGAKDDWMLHVHYWDPHTPYRTPMDFGNPFENIPLTDNWVDEETMKQHVAHVGPHSASEIGMYTDQIDAGLPRMRGSVKNLDEYKHFMDSYDTGILYTDTQIGILLDTLLKQGVSLDDLAVVITSDHGENMGELGLYAEHATADEATCRIPMIIKWPGGAVGTDTEFHTNVDLAPTIAELLGQPVWSEYDGMSYADTITNGKPAGQQCAVLTQCAHVCQRSVRFEDWLYIRTIHDGYHLFDREMLYNIADDPHETKNLASEHRELCDRGARLIADWTDEQMLRSDYDTDPIWTVMREGGPFHTRGHLKDYCERLRATGRADGAEELIRRHPSEQKLPNRD